MWVASMDWVLVLGVVGAIWAVVALTWRRGEGNLGGVPPGAWAQVTVRSRPRATPRIYGYGEDYAALPALGRPMRRIDSRLPAPEALETAGRPWAARGSERRSGSASPSRDPGAAQAADLPGWASREAPAPRRSAPETATVLPVRITDYQPGEQVIIQYVPTRAAAPQADLTAHQVGADVEIRLCGTTVAVLEDQRAGALIEQNLLQLVREETEAAPR